MIFVMLLTINSILKLCANPVECTASAMVTSGCGNCWVSKKIIRVCTPQMLSRVTPIKVKNSRTSAFAPFWNTKFLFNTKLTHMAINAEIRLAPYKGSPAKVTSKLSRTKSVAVLIIPTTINRPFSAKDKNNVLGVWVFVVMLVILYPTTHLCANTTQNVI